MIEATGHTHTELERLSFMVGWYEQTIRAAIEMLHRRGDWSVFEEVENYLEESLETSRKSATEAYERGDNDNRLG